MELNMENDVEVENCNKYAIQHAIQAFLRFSYIVIVLF
jgi:hypothetical protein